MHQAKSFIAVHLGGEPNPWTCPRFQEWYAEIGSIGDVPCQLSQGWWTYPFNGRVISDMDKTYRGSLVSHGRAWNRAGLQASWSVSHDVDRCRVSAFLRLTTVDDQRSKTVWEHLVELCDTTKCPVRTPSSSFLRHVALTPYNQFQLRQADAHSGRRLSALAWFVMQCRRAIKSWHSTSSRYSSVRNPCCHLQ